MMRRMVAVKTSHKEAIDLAAELMASGHVAIPSNRVNVSYIL